jgi:predicted RNA-binding protein with PIN domain
MSDIQRMSGDFRPPENEGELSVLTGCAPVVTMRGYQTEVTAYTRGRGRLFCTLKGYLLCHNSDEVINAIGYDSDGDLDNPAGSVFCSHGAGFVVEWDKVRDYMHVDSGWQWTEPEEPAEEPREEPAVVKTRTNYRGSLEEDKELEAIYIRTYGPIMQKQGNSRQRFGEAEKDFVEKVRIKQQRDLKEQVPVKEYLLVDGYNIIFSWDDLSKLAKENMDLARNRLMDILCNYQGVKKCILILVFDAYKVKGGVGEVLDYHNIHVVYTKEAETADAYIEKVTHEIAREHHVTVATSDALEQLIIMGQGAARLSAGDLKEEVTRAREQIRRDYLDRQPVNRTYLREQLDDNMRKLFEEKSNTEPE